MSTFYQCIICEHVNISIIDLHNHHMQYHNSIELSQAIINLQGFKVLNNIKRAKKNYLQPIDLGDNNNNNNENLYNHICNEGELQKNNIYRNKQEPISQRKSNHDKTICLLNCSQFIDWEHELNKRKEINDEEFFAIIESLCYDLSRRKRRGRKKKKGILIDEINTKIHIQQAEIANIGVTTEAVEESNNGLSQISTTSFWSVEHSMIDKSVNNQIAILPVKNEVEDFKNETTILTLTEVNTHQSVSMHNTVCNNFSYNSIINVNSDDQRMLVEHENIYHESPENFS